MNSSSSLSIVEYFFERPDPRIERTKQHSLLDIIGLAICAVIWGADGWTKIEAFGRAKQVWLQQPFEWPNGIPSHDTFGWVFTRLSDAISTEFSPVDPDDAHAHYRTDSSH